MITSDVTKFNKKQPQATDTLSDVATTRKFEQSLLLLEDICHDMKDGQYTHGRDDTDRLYWQQKLKNLAMRISLSLSEYKGPRVFHHHYKISGEDASTLTPVLESAHDNVMLVCTHALQECDQMVGMKGSKLLAERKRLMRALTQVIDNSL